MKERLTKTKKDRSELLDKIIRMIWESMESHLPFTYEKTAEGEEFHKQCVKDYAELILMLTKLY